MEPLQPGKYLEASRTRKYIVLVACLYLQAMSPGLGIALSVMYAELIQVFDSDRATASLIASIYGLLMASGGVIVSPLIRRYGPGPVVFGGTMLGALGFAVPFVATNISTVIGMVGVVGGIGLCVSYLASFIGAGWIFHTDPGVAIVSVTIGASVGQTVLPYLMELFIEQYNWNGAFLMISGVILQCNICACLLYTSRRYYKTDTKADDVSLIASVKKICDPSLTTDFVVLLVLFNSFLLTGTGHIEIFYFVDILTSRGYARERGSLLVAIMGMANTAGRTIGTIMRFKIRMKSIYHWIYLWPIVAIGHILALTLQNYEELTWGCVLYGVALGTCTALNQAIIYEVCGLARSPQGIAMGNLMYGVGNFFCSFVGGVVKDAVGEYDPMFYTATGAALYISLSSVIISLILRRRERQTYADEKEPLLYYESKTKSYTVEPR